jgi:hypothetical protein
MQHRNGLKTTKQPSLIDVVSEGFAAVNRRIWVLVLPVALDLFLWLGPRIGIAPLLAQVRALNPARWDQTLAAFGANTNEQLAALDLRFLLFLTPLRVVLPTLQAPPPPWAAPSWQLGSWAGMLGMLVVINMIALTLGALYLLPLASTVKNDAPRHTGRVVARVLGVAAIVLGTLFAVSLVVLVLASVLSLLAEPLAMFVVVVWLAIATWFAFATSFSFDAVVIDGLNSLRAVWRSFVVVQRALWGALGLWLITTLVVLGFDVIWSTLAGGGSIGLVLAIVGSAYITTGLAAAHLVFFRNRSTQLAQRPAAQRPA